MINSFSTAFYPSIAKVKMPCVSFLPPFQPGHFLRNETVRIWAETKERVSVLISSIKLKWLTFLRCKVTTRTVKTKEWNTEELPNQLVWTALLHHDDVCAKLFGICKTELCRAEIKWYMSWRNWSNGSLAWNKHITYTTLIINAQTVYI